MTTSSSAKYTPETKFSHEKGKNFVYNLREQIQNNRRYAFVNDVLITIDARHLSSEVIDKIADTIKNALNSEFPV